MKRILSKSLLIAISLFILFSIGCAKPTMPDTVAEVEKTWYAFEQRKITYDKMKDRIAGYYIDFDQTVGEEVFMEWKHADDEGKILYKELEGMPLKEIKDLAGSASNDFKPSSSQVSVSKPMDYYLDQQMVFAWRKAIVEDLFPDETCMIRSTCYYFTEVDGEWKIGSSETMGAIYQVTDPEEKIQMQIDVATMPYQDEAEYVQTITLK